MNQMGFLTLTSIQMIPTRGHVCSIIIPLLSVNVSVIVWIFYTLLQLRRLLHKSHMFSNLTCEKIKIYIFN